MSEMFHLTPTWVFGVFFILLYFGYVQSKAREVAKASLLIVPVAMIGLSLFSVWSAFGLSVTGYAFWAIGVVLALLLNRALQQPRGVRYLSDSGRFSIPGSYVPLALMMAIFFTKYFITATIATQFLSPKIPAFVAIGSFILGLFSGTFAARARKMWQTGGAASI